MKITSYGLFWRKAEINWYPGSGIRNEFHLLGRVGKKKPKFQVADFRLQQGIYILYDDYGPCYTGLTRSTSGLGKRLKDHTSDHLEGKWDRFSWFGFRNVAKKSSDIGIYGLIDADTDVMENTHTTIGDLESLLIQLLGTKLNKSQMKFDNASRWEQVSYEEREGLLEKIRE